MKFNRENYLPALGQRQPIFQFDDQVSYKPLIEPMMKVFGR